MCIICNPHSVNVTASAIKGLHQYIFTINEINIVFKMFGGKQDRGQENGSRGTTIRLVSGMHNLTAG